LFSDPCRYNIGCHGSNHYNLRTYFESIIYDLNENEKHFNGFYFNNSAIDSLEEDVFNDITFERIYIENAHNLTRIHSRAFTATTLHTTSIYIFDTPIINNDCNYNIFAALSSVIYLETIYLINTSLTSIPNNAFRPILLGLNNKLKEIYIWNNNKLQTIGSNAFYDLYNLENLRLYDNIISYISEHAFAFRYKSTKKLAIDLESNNLDATNR